MTRYNTGEPCRKGHLADRFASNGNCEECLRESNRKYQQDHRDELLAKKLAWAKKNPEKNRQQSIGWQRENWNIARAVQRKARQKRADHYRTEARIAAAKRRAALLERTPPWSDLEAIAEIYRACPTGMAVDHMVPLQGRTVSGLHVSYNLQDLTKSENSGKGARWE